jgi:primosomal protein N' (replication factor Y) (superfamily II helicase)
VPYARVALDSPVAALDRPFDYAIPERLDGRIAVGSVVRVVLHGRGMRAFVTDLLDEPAVASPRPLRSLVSEQPLFGAAELELARWAARRYVVPLGLVLHDAVPGRFSAPKEAGDASPLPERTERPQWVTDELDKVLDKRGEAIVFPPSLRDEPEFVAHAAGEAVARASRALVICPRIDTAERIAAVIRGAAVMHSDDKPAERARVWADAREGKVHVLVGGRSALFAPMPDLGLVIVCSAHDRSLKSERAPRIYAPVVARERARRAGASFIVSSPAPPVELASGNVVSKGRGIVRPETARPRETPITPRLIEVVRSAVDHGTDGLVFAGRRGDVLRLRCPDCGTAPTCPKCGSGLAIDAAKNRLVCRVCTNTTPMPDACAVCGGALAQRGWGHERIARALEKLDIAPVIPIVADDPQRPVRDSPAILVGTLAAAHSVSEVGSVCVADLDQLLMRADFRAGERAIQTLFELASVLVPGGRFLVQTREPEHHAVQAFTRGSFRFFLDRELAFRKETGYPPFGVVVSMQIQAADIAALSETLRPARGAVIGTVPRGATLRALIRAPDLEPLLDPLRAFAAEHSRTKIDVDPVDVL